MADDGGKSDSVGSWPGLLDEVNKTFNLMRDVFGYALPGGAFLAIGLVSGRFNLWEVQNLLKPYQLPAWAALIALVAACYPVGTVMAAAAYMPFMVAKYWVWMRYRHPAWPLWRMLGLHAPKSTPPPPAREVYEHIERHEWSGPVERSDQIDLIVPLSPAEATPPGRPRALCRAGS